MPDATTSSTRPPLHLEDLAIGDRFVSGPLAVTAEDVAAYARQYDPQPFHLDEAAACDSFFGGLVASGWQTAALTMRLLVTDGPPIAGGIVGAGVELRWPRPTYPGDTLHLSCTVEAITPSRSRPERGVVTLHCLTLNQDDAIVQDMHARILAFRRDAPTTGTTASTSPST